MPEEQISQMTVAGWVFLAASWATITLVMVFCIARVFRPAKGTPKGTTPSE